MGNTEAVTERSEKYIKRWKLGYRAHKKAGRIALFGSLPIGAKFTLPGGKCQQVKLSPCLATGGGFIMNYAAWEEVVSL